ncbi:unnamed protein product [Rhizophagus irregularis]|nr:unnamed protein product [Rhizophagus irregularis]
MSKIIEEFNITKCQRLSQLNEKIIKQYETQTGARIILNTGQITTLTISGNSSEFKKAKILIRDFLEKNSFIPKVYYFILDRSILKNNDKLKFVKFHEETIEINDDVGDGGDNSLEDSDRKAHYFVEFLQQNNETDDDDDSNKPEEFLNSISPYHFNTYNKIEDCLERLYLKIKTTIKRSYAFPDQIVFKPNIYLGKALFSDVINPEDTFVLKEWYMFNILSEHGSRESIDDYTFDGEFYNNNTVNTAFHQGSLQIKENFKILEQKFDFKLDSEQVAQDKNKGKISIYYSPGEFKRRKITLRWSERENKWKVTVNAHGLNRLAHIDILSGSKEPDIRLSLKTFYNLPSEGSEIEETVDKVQSQIFYERDGMWFKSDDFIDTIIKRAVVRQVIEKKRYKNKDFFITFSTVKQDNRGKITIQNFIKLKHRFWKQKISKISLDNVEDFMKSASEILHYARELISAI